MAEVFRQDNESLERLISRFRRVVIRKGVMKQIRSTRYFRKPLSGEMEKRKAIFREFKRTKAQE